MKWVCLPPLCAWVDVSFLVVDSWKGVAEEAIRVFEVAVVRTSQGSLCE